MKAAMQIEHKPETIKALALMIDGINPPEGELYKYIIDDELDADGNMTISISAPSTLDLYYLGIYTAEIFSGRY